MILVQRLYLPVLLFLILSVSARAAEQQAPTARAHSLQPGCHALLFRIGDRLQLEAFDGVGIAFRHQHSRTEATRISLTVKVDRTHEMTTNNDQVRDPGILERRRQFDTSSSLDAGSLRLHYREDARNLHNYWGWGPVMSAGWHRVEQSNAAHSSYVPVHVYKEVSVSGGLKTVLGAEWFITREISLHAEYGLALILGHTRLDSGFVSAGYYPPNNPGTLRGRISNSLDLDPLPVAFGLSVFF